MKKNIFDEQATREIKSKDNTFGKFLVNNGLYDEIEITKDNVFELADLVGGLVKINVFCPECGELRVFSGEMIPFYIDDDENQVIIKHSLQEDLIRCQNKQSLNYPHFESDPEPEWIWTYPAISEATRLMVFRFTCAMDDEHHLDYIVTTNGNTMKKIGQYPSVADLTVPELKEYRKVASKEDIDELKRAIGLNAHGIGVGSYVYLRRIFERMIDSAGKKAIEQNKIDEKTLKDAHIEDKIRMLADYLPKSLVDNKAFYGIVSKGIHEMSEDDCLLYFPVMKDFIIKILRQWETIRKDEEDDKRINTALNKIVSNIKS